MIVAAETFLTGCKVVLESQLVSTLLGIVLGSYFIEKLHVNRESERETLRWLITHVEEYGGVAVRYWNAILHKQDVDDLDILKARMRSEYPFLVSATDNLKCICKDRKRIHDTTYAIMDLFRAATDGQFDSSMITDEEAAAHISRCEDAAVKVKRLLYGYLTEWDSFCLAKLLVKIKAPFCKGDKR